MVVDTLLVVVIALTIRSMVVRNTKRKVHFCLVPSFRGVGRTKINGMMFTTLDRSFFALSVNVNTVLVFKDCLSGSEDLAKRTMDVAMLSAFITLATKFVVVPTYFSCKVRPSTNPDLVFVALPGVFTGVDKKTL